MYQLVILGGSGYIGQNVCQQWFNRFPNSQITSITRHGRPQNLIPALHQWESKITWQAGDITDYKKIQTLLPAKIDYLINLIGGLAAKTPAEMAQLNILPAQMMLRIMGAYQVNRGSFVSAAIGSKDFINAKQKASQLLQESGRSIKIVSPSLVYDAKRKRVWPLVALLYIVGIFSPKMRPLPVKVVAQQLVPQTL
ncbi:NAD-dependent epimerase/dehydratase family protein [Loigolactobacillus iwatensis]|uniref:NAD-dependent epimerase/dehydratase family protein n=1 Tax=Loigolactobacillus iwatensis TaxID=1267156 RepID=UPI000F7EFE22|nr:NAD-dependent epimerase/dehydratase family protein [Loigolactobacillus iwatensis]